ncbi:MAG: efflux RND transporter periplasmic adaptor subunit [Terriglobales bacterium]
MTDNLRRQVALMPALFLLALAVACSGGSKAAPTKSEVTVDPNLYHVDHPELFTLAKVGTQNLPTLLNANGAVTPDVNRNIHVTSQGSGRVVDLRVKLGDSVKKGQVLLTIYSADLTGAFSDYQKTQADERLSKKALERAQLLYSHGALAQKDLEVAQDTEDKAKVDVQNTQQHVRLLGGDPAHPSSVIELRAPLSGTIVEQNVSGFEGIKSLDNSPNLFTIRGGPPGRISWRGVPRQSGGYFTRARPQSSLGQGPNRAAQPQWGPASEYVRGGNFPFHPTAPAAGGAHHSRNALAGQRLDFS